jgi:uncharacterized Zn finger protein (UPF0148 family)
MSEFDKEAERERLREKYERDREKRAATQRMSELLLKGATMTNDHCEECGDPIFRHDGQEFCPTCQASDEADTSRSGGEETTPTGADGTDDAGADAADDAGANAAVDAGTGTETDDAGANAAVDAGTGTETDDRRPPISADAHERPPASAAPADAGAADADAGNRRRDTAEHGTAPSARDTPLDDTRVSLSRTLDRFARAAEETDDPRRARELLAAAREAAETLAALDDRGRF